MRKDSDSHLAVIILNETVNDVEVHRQISELGISDSLQFEEHYVTPEKFIGDINAMPVYMNGLAQECSNSSAVTPLELPHWSYRSLVLSHRHFHVV